MQLKKKRIMRTFKINEISGVDVPAQQGARVTIMKRAEPGQKDDDAKKRMYGDLVQLLTSETEGHQHGIKMNVYDDGDISVYVMRALGDGAESEHDHPIVRNQDNAYQMGVVAGHTHEIDSAALGALILNLVTTKGKGVDMDGKDKNTELSVENFAALQKRLDRAEQVMKLVGDDRTHFDGLKEEGQTAFLEKSAEDRATEIAAAKAALEGDPVVYTTTDGVELRKSVGPLFISLAKSNDKVAKENKALLERLENAELLKRVEKEFKHLPGTAEERAELIKAVESIPDETKRTAAMNAMKSQNDALKGITETLGTSAGITIDPEDDSPDSELEKLAQAYAKEHKVTEAVGFAKVTETGRGAELYAKMVE